MPRWAQIGRDERGATAALFAILSSLVLLISAAFAVDLGQQRLVRSDMQAVADVAALDLARHLDGGTVAHYDKSAFSTELVNSLKRNTSSFGDALSADGECRTGMASSVEVGACWEFVKSNGGSWEDELGQDATPDAVRVYARSEARFAFGGFTGVTHGSATRPALASSAPSGCFSLGSFALGIESGNSALLSALFNGNLGINGQVVGYNGLADTDVSLLGLMAAAKVGTVSSLADVNVSTFFADLAQSSVADDATLQLLGLIGASSKLDPKLTVGDLIDLTGAGPDVLDSKINLLDLVSSGLYVANGTNFIDAPAGVTIPGLAGLKVGLQVIERPRMACAAGEASTGQVRLQVRATVGGLINLDLGITLAQAKGKISGIACSNGAATAMTVQTYDQALVALLVKATVLSADPPESQPIAVTGAGDTYEVDLTDSNYAGGTATNSGAIAVPQITLAALGIDLGPLLNAVLKPLLQGLSAPLTSFVRSSLGITVAGAKIWPTRTPTCGLPRLVG